MGELPNAVADVEVATRPGVCQQAHVVDQVVLFYKRGGYSDAYHHQHLHIALGSQIIP